MDIRKLISTGPSSPFAKDLKAALDEMESGLHVLCQPAGELREGLERILGAGGKRLRPMLAWTCWHMCGGKMPIVPLMSMLELMHTTSLIHDDFVDAAEQRRGVPTINHTDGADAAIRSGDYLLARAMDYLETYRGTGINERLSEVSQEMCLGELDQNEGLFSAEKSGRERYFTRIRRKTALLMAEACRCGAIAGGGSGLVPDILWEFGLHLGTAFQLRDDLMDWDPDSKSGKPLLKDLYSGVMTLPLIFAIEQGDEKLIAIAQKKDKNIEDTEYVLRCVADCGTMDKTYRALKTECSSAVRALNSLPSGAERESLLLLTQSIMEVKHSG